MCGIFGIAATNTVDRDQFCQLGELNKQRGNLAFGCFVGALNQDPSGRSWVDSRVFRYAQPFDAVLVTQEQVQITLGHIRAPTAGQSANPVEIHPFETPAGYLAHNGLLLNHTQFPEWRVNPNINVDSQVIVGGIQHHLHQGLETWQAIKSTVERLEGQQACWYWHQREQCMYLWRVMSPIYINMGTSVFRFSSVQSRLADTLLTEGRIYKFSLPDFVFTEVGKFSFHSPYQI
ncbi:Amidophosphoribosyltransferase [Candidatus Entotheonellaceae bacterium PAL068K]